jgi:hypothetical protein
MPGRILPDFFNPALDANGEPISGATLTYYRNKTATLQNIYTNPTLAVAHPNPLVADSAGRFRDVWAPFGETYSIVAKNAAGTVVKTLDDIEPLGNVNTTSDETGGDEETVILNITDFRSEHGEEIHFIAAFTNNGPVTVKPTSGADEIDVVKDTSGGPAALSGGEIVAGNAIHLWYDEDGDQLHLFSFPPAQALGTISPTAIITTEHDWHPTGLHTADVMRLTATGAQTITGIDAPPSSVLLTLQNTGTDAITLANENTGSGAVNRFALPFDVVLYQNNAVTLRYDLTSTRWRLTDKVASETALSGQFTALSIKNNSGTPNTHVDLAADSVTMADANGNVVRKTALAVTINCTTVGANGMDAGALANTTWYAVWAIYNPTTGTTAGLVSTSGTAPTMPSGYTYKARFGWVRTDGSAHFLVTKQYGRKAHYAVPRQLATGSSGDALAPTWVGTAVATFVPTTAFAISVFLTNDGSPDPVAAAPTNAYGAVDGTTNPPPLTSSASTPYAMQGDWVLQGTSVYYASTNAGGGLYCMGWEDNL